MLTSPSTCDKGRLLRHAVVLGGSIAGLLAAGVLSERAEQVTLIERDLIPDTPQPRKGVPQSLHIHGLLAGGHLVMERLFPGLTAELRAAGALALDGGRDLAWNHEGHWRARCDGNFTFLSMSRSLVESSIARRVRALPNVTIRDGASVEGCRIDGTRVAAVRIRSAGGAGEEVEGDLFVDALGRGSPTLSWLASREPMPEPELLPARIAYASCFVRLPDRRPDWRALIVGGATARRRGLIFPVEGERWLVTLVGYFDQVMPRDHESFRAFARSLQVPDLGRALEGAEPLSPVVRYHFAGSLRRRYERVEALPDGLIALGDAVCSFNPVYGQGMSIAALEAEHLALTLDKAEGRGLEPGFAGRWFRDLAPIVDRAWRGVSLEDLRFPELADRRPAALRPLQWYMGRLQRATCRSPRLTEQFYRVINFLDEPGALFRPGIVADVLSGGRLGGAARWTGRQRRPELRNA
jgi:2-polyprenyl-6-methoxyphenol hydroxylase-like FAD-dependent oxidoreductase